MAFTQHTARRRQRVVLALVTGIAAATGSAGSAVASDPPLYPANMLRPLPIAHALPVAQRDRKVCARIPRRLIHDGYWRPAPRISYCSTPTRRLQ